jgi:hypothetical protein
MGYLEELKLIAIQRQQAVANGDVTKALQFERLAASLQRRCAPRR